MSTTIHTDVLIVGAGVTGLTAAALLARQRIPAITISKYPSTASTPRAHITNQRTLEVLRDLGIEEHAYQSGQMMHEVPDTIWVTSLAGRELARRRSWGTRADRQGDYQAASPCSLVNIGQHLLEPIIHRRAIELERVRRNGYATTNEETTLGACSVAVPVLRAEDVVAALGFVVPSLKRSRPRLVAAVDVAAQAISRSIASHDGAYA